MSPRAVQHFNNSGDNEVITRAVARTAISTFEQHACLDFLPQYLTMLKEHGVEHVELQLLRDRCELHASYSAGDPLPDTVRMKSRVLRILEYLCQVVNNPPFDINNPSENDALLVWAHVFGIARSNSSINLQTGERMLEASKALRQQQAAEFGDLSDAGRKVDLAFVHKGIELSNIEFKKAGIGAMEIAVQCRKNIRLGRCLQEQHRQYGVEDPSVVMGDVA
ncbi:hypothetical protein BGW41_008145, partial [Actinomortierella wolfii]